MRPEPVRVHVLIFRSWVYASLVLFTAIGFKPVACAESALVTIEVKKGALAEAANLALLGHASPAFGGALMIEQDGVLVLKAGYGYADRKRRVPFRADTIAQIGSITKSFTAAAVADLESKGEVRPQAPVSTYLTELEGKSAGAVTIQQLLTHTGGYPEYCGDDFSVLSRSQLLHECLAMIDAKPGSYAYSNAGYSALALVVEQVSGMSLEKYLQRNITGPLGMRHTGYVFRSTLRSEFARGYLDGIDQGVISEKIAALHGDYWNLKGNGGIQASAGDMMTWGRAIFGGPPALPVMADRLMDRRNWSPAMDSTTFYSYGLFIGMRADDSIQRISHTGSDGVFFSLFRWYPEERILLYFVGNSGEDDVRVPMLALLDAIKVAAPIRP